ncbi:MAG: hypothetical protein KatS3mg115_0458 [Candidatus Poribacteria bacterium]|nr:MAG: hypothetical protein KatS3mg115_0458 [Candidatus Poribacteria bacterium]
MKAPRILICDDERNIGLILTRALRPLGYDAEAVETFAQAQERLEAGTVDVLFLDIFLPDANGLEELPRLRQRFPQVPVVVLTAHGTMRTALEAMKRHAFEYLTKPFDLGQVREIAERAVLARQQAVQAAQSDAPQLNGEEMIGHSPLMQEVFKTIGRVAESEVTVLLHGGERYRQGVGRPSDSRKQPSGPGAVCRRQLCGHSGSALGERTVRARPRGLYQRRLRPQRPIRTGSRWHPLSGRDRRDAPGPAD